MSHVYALVLCYLPIKQIWLHRGHGKGVDYWALGCLIYEFIVSITPFEQAPSDTNEQDQTELIRKIINCDMTFPYNMSSGNVEAFFLFWRDCLYIYFWREGSSKSTSQSIFIPFLCFFFFLATHSFLGFYG